MESTTNYDTSTLVVGGKRVLIGDGTIVADAGRTAVLKENTVLGFIPSTGKWTPFVGATLATTVNVGVYIGADVASADLVAGDVAGAEIIIGGTDRLLLREDMIVIDEDASTLDTEVGTGDTATTARHILYRAGMFAQNSNTLYTA